jgi:hypothetical protein
MLCPDDTLAALVAMLQHGEQAALAELEGLIGR